jgi:ribosomal protein S18 acetylase RimI-like enzyme
MQVNLPHTLKYIWQEVGDRDGWKVFEKDKLLMLKSPCLIPNLNLAILSDNNTDTSIIASYFNDACYGVIYPFGMNLSYNNKPLASVQITEMHLSANDIEPMFDVNVEIVATYEELDLWSQTSGQVFGFAKEEMMKFLQPLYKGSSTKLLYYKEDGKIVGVGQINIDDNNLVYISSIGVLEEYRRRGIGKKIMNACLLQGKELGGKVFGLHASPEGEFLYRELNFNKNSVWSFDVF